MLKDLHLPGRLSDYQLDHAVSLELGGAPYSTRNLWMEPNPQARVTDQYENALHKKLCAGEIKLVEAQRDELTYKRQRG